MSADRYRAAGTQAEVQSGLRGRVLRNLLGITSTRKMAVAESAALLDATKQLIAEFAEDHRFEARDICAMHHLWLGGIYQWAGEYRRIQLSKDGFPFANAALIDRLMMDFERDVLRRFTPCMSNDIQEQAEALAVVHAELILIHPFRDGNGRCARLLSMLMALQAGLPPLDFGGIRGAEKRRYISAIHAAMGQDYEPMKTVFRKVIARSLRSYAREARV